ncbi:MAG: hypothetical protein F6K21_02245 [Symploca sp. SIO2D2]|nr:hypothetical protein [Symploca sp. SIO2D2]
MPHFHSTPFNNTKKYQQFRAWLESVGATIKKLPDGAFLAAKLRTTGTSTQLVVIHK